jgi:hypothetical protein
LRGLVRSAAGISVPVSRRGSWEAGGLCVVSVVMVTMRCHASLRQDASANKTQIVYRVAGYAFCGNYVVFVKLYSLDTMLS